MYLSEINSETSSHFSLIQPRGEGHSDSMDRFSIELRIPVVFSSWHAMRMFSPSVSVSYGRSFLLCGISVV